MGLGQRSLQTQRAGVEVTGHNLANVNTPGYTRQRLLIVTSPTTPGPMGPQGTGADAMAIEQMGNVLVDRQIQTEESVSGYWEAQQSALQYAQADLGQAIDRQAADASGADAAQASGSQVGLAEGLADLFNGFQSLATNPTSLSERQVLTMKAQTLSTQFNQVDQRLDKLTGFLNDSVTTDVATANRLLGEVTTLNEQIYRSELGTSGVANDLRDTRQQKLEELAQVTNFQTVDQSNGMVDIVISGQTLVSGVQQTDSLETYDAGGGQLLLRTQTGGTALTLTGGSIQGTISARDGEVKTLKDDLNTLAAQLITTVNAIHSSGYSLTGSTKSNFFDGTNAADIQVNSALLNNPALIQASGTLGAVGDNSQALALAQLAEQPQAALHGQTFSQSYGQTVAAMGQSLSSVNNQLSDQQVVENLLKSQRDSFSGVSLDEEMTNLMKFQKAFQASARLINTIDEMLDTVLSLKR